MITKVLSPAVNAAVVAIFRPHGQHRRPLLLPDAPHPAPAEPVQHGVLDEAELTQLLDAEQIVANESADCPACERNTFHAMNRNGSRKCWTCQTTTIVQGGDSRG